MRGEETRISPLPTIDLNSADYAGIRVWIATRPIYDDSPVPDRGTVGYHVHAYNKDGSGKKVIDDTYEYVTINGKRIRDASSHAVDCTWNNYDAGDVCDCGAEVPEGIKGASKA